MNRISTFYFALFSLIALAVSSCEKEQDRYDNITKMLEGNWKITRIITSDNEVFNNVGTIQFDACNATPENRTCSGTATDSLGKSYTLLVELQAGKSYPDALINISDRSNEGPSQPLSLLVNGQGYIIGETKNNKLRWTPSDGRDLPAIELEKP
jgi:hypothetical protein